MFLLKFILTLILFYYLGRVLWRVLLMGAAHNKISIGQMVACEHCGIYVAKEQAIMRNGKAYCTETCIDIN
jgi:hypothetical protein